MRFLHSLSGNQAVSNLVEELDCFIDTRRNMVYRQYCKTEEYQKMPAEIEKFREKFSTLDAELVGQYEMALAHEQNYISTHEYLQGILDGMALRKVFHSLEMKP